MGKVTDPSGAGSANVVDATTPVTTGKKALLVVSAGATGTSSVKLQDGAGNPVTSTDEGGGVRSLDVAIKSGSTSGPTATPGVTIGASGVPVMGKSPDGHAHFLPIAEVGQPSPGKGQLIMGTDDTVLRALKVRADGAATVEATPYLWSMTEGNIPGHTIINKPVFATMATSTRQLLVAGVWNEQATGGQRSIASTSASDGVGGTGAQKILLQYIDTLGAAQAEVLTLAGLTPVNTVATDIKWIRGMTVIQAGTGAFAAGTISLYSATAGGGVIMSEIVVGESRLQTSVHYVPVGVTAYLARFSITTDDKGQIYFMTTDDYTILGGGANVVTARHQIYVEKRSTDIDLSVPSIVTGGQKLWAEVIPQSSGTFVSIQTTGWEE